MTILVDTGPLVALCDSRDSKHRAAVAHLAALRGSLLVCSAVLAETCFHLAHLAQRQRLRALLARLNISPATGEEEASFREEVFEWLFKYSEHEPDWADGCLAILSARNREAKVWTYDSEFKTTWRRPNGTVIPLIHGGDR